MPENISEIKAERVTETLVVYQQKGVFSFGTDAMLLADYVSEQQSAAVRKSCATYAPEQASCRLYYATVFWVLQPKRSK